MTWAGRYRRATQLACLAGFAALIALGASGPAIAWLPFRLDPLVAVPALIAGTASLAVVLWAVGALVFAVLAGRAFCTWICPLGTALDLVRRATAPFGRRFRRRPPGWLGRLPLAVLAALLLAAALGLPLLGLVEPMALIERAAATAFAPWLRDAGERLRPRPALDHVPAPGFIDEYRFIGAPVRVAHPGYALGWIPAAILGAILLAELALPRLWCRALCPSGALLGLCGRRPLLRQLPGPSCGGSCQGCVERCPSAPRSGPDLTRRGLLAAGLAGAALPLLGGSVRRAGAVDPHRIRPPGAAEGGDARFLEACVRCGACVAVCPTHGLQPALLADGLGGLFAPRLVPRQGPCEHACNACAAVCPTHAIPLLELAAKQQAKLGLAVHDHARCLPWSGGGECRVCQEHCPVEGKAIKLKLAFAPNGQAIPLPSVDADRCVGCGTCEFVCPIEGAAGIRVADRAAADQVRARFQPASSGA